MALALKILNAALILFAAYMGFKQGAAMLTGKPAMTDMFAKWNIGKTGVMIIGALTILSAGLMLFPKTFVWGNFIMAAGIHHRSYRSKWWFSPKVRRRSWGWSFSGQCCWAMGLDRRLWYKSRAKNYRHHSRHE